MIRDANKDRLMLFPFLEWDNRGKVIVFHQGSFFVDKDTEK